jgi:hypothetical protein
MTDPGNILASKGHQAHFPLRNAALSKEFDLDISGSGIALNFHETLTRCTRM